MRLFGLLPAGQSVELKTLWHEFEAGASADARFAQSLDRLQPLIHNVANSGGTWREARLSEEQVIARYGPAIGGGSQTLWGRARELVRRHFAGDRKG